MTLAKSFSRYGDLSILALRLAIGVVFLYHGTMKWSYWTSAPEGMSGNMVLLFQTLAVIEPLAGIGLVLGVFTRVCALVLGVVMLGAIFTKIQVMGVGFAGTTGTGWEFDLVLLAGAVTLLTLGAGSYALDKKSGW